MVRDSSELQLVKDRVKAVSALVHVSMAEISEEPPDMSCISL